MNNKPVAWMGLTAHNQNRVSIEKLANDDIPLYIHPVKELTDEEWLITYQTWALTGNDPLVLKQAILRKAQEK